MWSFSGPVKPLLAALALGIAAGAPAPCPAQEPPGPVAAELDPHRLELAREIVDIAYPPPRRREMLLAAVDAITAQARSAATGSGQMLDSDVDRILQRYLERSRSVSDRAIVEHIPALFGAFARAYARQFTIAELTEIRAFVGTPAGSKYVQRSPGLLSDPDVAQANSAYIATVMAALRPLQADLRRELTDYSTKRAGEARRRRR